MKSSAIMGLLVVMACASGGSGGEDQSANIRHLSYGDAGLGADPQSGAPITWHDIPASAALTWQFLPVAFSRLRLTITRYDSAAHIIEGERLGSRAEFGGRPFSSLLNCGDVVAVPTVTRDDVNIRVRTAVRGSDKESSVASVVNASAKATGLAGDPTPCGVSAGISERVAAAVAEAVADVAR